MSRRQRQEVGARLRADRDRLAGENTRLRARNRALLEAVAGLRAAAEAASSAVVTAVRVRPPAPSASYHEIRTARHVAQVELRNAAARYGRLANWRTRTHAHDEELRRAKRDLDDAGLAFAAADRLLTEVERELAVEVGLASTATTPEGITP